jgi:predicted dehydrogenase
LTRTSGGKIRAGFIGVGGFGAMRRRWVRESERFEIVAGVDSSREAIDVAMREEGAEFSREESVESLVARDDLDVIFVTTPAHLHVEHAMAAARAGKDVFVEKPLSHDLSAARELVRFCNDRKLLLGVGFTMRQQPGALRCKQLIESGELGTIVAANITNMHSGGLTIPADNWRFRREWNPGGPLFQLGVHELDLLRWWFGDGKVVSAIARHDISGKPTPDAFTLLLRFGEIAATLHAHYVCAYHHGAQIFGTKANLYYSLDPETVVVQRQRAGAKEPREVVELPGVSEVDAMVAFADAVRDRTPYVPNGDDGVATLEMVFDAIDLSKKTKHLSS